MWGLSFKNLGIKTKTIASFVLFALLLLLVGLVGLNGLNGAIRGLTDAHPPAASPLIHQLALAKNWLLILMSTGTVLAVVLGWALAHSVEKEEMSASPALDESSMPQEGNSSAIRENVAELDAFTEQFSSFAQELTSHVGVISEGVHIVLGVAEMIQNSMVNASSAAELSTENMNLVASATEEMNSSVHMIFVNAEEARRATQEAVNNVGLTSGKMADLEKAAKEISAVIEVINEIADQTKLLALNATIEAARAGEAGKGFAVVANEVKELAKQTNDATSDIRARVEAIQSSTEQSLSDFGMISTLIGGIDSSSASTATAVEQQTIATKEIAENIMKAAAGNQEMASSMAENSISINEVVAALETVNTAVAETTNVCSQLAQICCSFKFINDQIKDSVGL